MKVRSFLALVSLFALAIAGDGQEKTAPAANLRIRVAASSSDGKAILEPTGTAWTDAQPTSVLLNRTPRIYQTEPKADRPPPRLEVRGVRASGKLYLRLQWDDATKNAPEAPAKKTGEGGDADKIYKRPTGETATFPDTAAVMVPQEWTGPAFPSLVMGDKANPARIFYWNATRGTQELTATGRGLQKPTGQTFPHNATYADGKWTLAVELPDRPDGYPVAFAVWDGQHQDRDGLKFFSIWYVLSP